MKKISFIFFFIIFGCTKPEVDLRIVDAKDIYNQVATHAGKDVVLVNFWATHCGPCIEEMPYIIELEQEYKNQGFKVYFVSNDWLDRKNAVYKFLINIGVRGISFLLTFPYTSDELQIIINGFICNCLTVSNKLMVMELLLFEKSNGLSNEPFTSAFEAK